ncbi:YkvA family protein [Roseibium sediminis]|uniref:YkvA family protein n=1 Tax=Roseibium sediminis TaxID=1775174 RepID=UPI00123E366F|nr:DUF1232 domain-containing protein [Roseibium sediminis]
MIARLRRWARLLLKKAVLVWLAARDNRVPWLVRALAAIVAIYALSPIDLIPDFIPVFGLLDDLLLVPLGVWLVIRCLPPGLLAELEEKAELQSVEMDRRTGFLLIAATWLLAALVTGWIVWAIVC